MNKLRRFLIKLIHQTFLNAKMNSSRLKNRTSLQIVLTSIAPGILALWILEANQLQLHWWLEQNMTPWQLGPARKPLNSPCKILFILFQLHFAFQKMLQWMGQLGFFRFWKLINQIIFQQSGGVDWRRTLETQKGAVLATEMKNNACKLAKWTLQAVLAGSDFIKLGYVSRAKCFFTVIIDLWIHLF